MKAIKIFFAVLFVAITTQFAGTEKAEAKPAAKFQSIVVRTGPRHHRPMRRWHRRRVWHRRHVMMNHRRPM